MTFATAWNWVWRRAFELAVAMTIVYVVTAGIEYREDRRKLSVEATDWFEVHELFVPDHAQGSDPLLFYDRTIKRPFTGLWVVEAQARDDEGRYINVCSGNGLSDYEPEDRLPPEGVRWTWFFDRECAIPPGTYRLAVVYDMRIAGYPMKRYRVRSNIFHVTP